MNPSHTSSATAMNPSHTSSATAMNPFHNSRRGLTALDPSLLATLRAAAYVRGLAMNTTLLSLLLAMLLAAPPTLAQSKGAAEDQVEVGAVSTGDDYDGDIDLFETHSDAVRQQASYQRWGQTEPDAGESTGRDRNASTSCSDFLDPYVEWVNAEEEGAGEYRVNVVLISNNMRGHARYADGFLELSSIRARGSLTFSGEVTRYKSEKMWGFPTSASGDIEFDTFPFDPDQTDELAVVIDVNTGRVTLEGVTIDNPECANGVLFGFARASSGISYVIGAHYYVISLTRSFISTRIAD